MVLFVENIVALDISVSEKKNNNFALCHFLGGFKGVKFLFYRHAHVNASMD